MTGDRTPPRLSDAEQIAALKSWVDDLEIDLGRTRMAAQEARITSLSLTAELDRVRTASDRLRSRRSVRLALELSRRLTPLVAFVGRVSEAPRSTLRSVRGRVGEARQARRRASGAAQRAMAARIRRAAPPAVIDDAPTVSVLIVSRRGGTDLVRCLAAVSTTAYRPIEIVVVDDGSGPPSDRLVERFGLAFPLTVIHTPEGGSFEDAYVDGMAVATGSLICLLDTGVEPITDHWLGYLVETFVASSAAAVGARLIDPSDVGRSPSHATFKDPALRDRGVTFERAGPIPLPRVLGDCDDPVAMVEVADRPALTPACLLVNRTDLERTRGLAAESAGRLDDVGVSLGLSAAGRRLVVDGRAAMWLHRIPVPASDAKRHRASVTRDREALIDRWGARVFRDAFIDALRGGARYSSRPFHVAIAITNHDPDAGAGDWYTGHELGNAMEGLGWRVTYLARSGDDWEQPDPSVEAVVVLLDGCDIRRMPRNLVSMAWIRSWPERWLARPWFDDYDLVFASSEPIATRVRQLSAKVATVLPIATNPDRFGSPEPRPDLECDVLFVGSYWNQHRAVIDALPALAAQGYAVHVHGRGWHAVPGFAQLDRGFLAYGDVPRAYASARVVIDDAALPTISNGSVNSRVFDSMAAGAILLSNGSMGIHELFGDDVPTWTSARSLIDLVGTIFRDPEPARTRALALQALVLTEHTYASRAVAIRQALQDWASSTRFGLCIGVTGREAADGSDDYHLARALQRSLERAGHPTRVHFRSEWADPVGAREDVSVHLLGRHEAPTRSGQINLLWHVTHPERATPDLYDRYDGVFVASDGFAARMAQVSRTDVGSLHMATDPARFWPDPTGPTHEILFIAGSEERRRVPVDHSPSTDDLAVNGRGWTQDLVDPAFVMADAIPHEDLRRYYSSADIVVTDHSDEMRAEGFISNRVYDALACDAFVISDRVDGIDAEFDGSVITYASPDELASLVERYLADPSERRRLAERGGRIVRERHTFDVSARTLVEAATVIAERRHASGSPAADSGRRTMAS